ncbi:hypothetical protein IQ273_07540 [Nodosilinea sp. LEGE 07298]|uniref:hypothetical protein n=1 Tax=Nodosilinea sp. LEGE 07298 TaxID=2777970 RepID=UPI00187F7E4E|nr:hypothetical protein [Nodosilinea sp. LEGE 07298]MBE9109266.1 hypothetical protein [Nodosilinea sp. LEGE 07298]
MTFGGSPHSAEKVQHDINSILDAIAQMLAKVRLQERAEEEKLEQAPPLLEERPGVEPAWVSITDLDDEQKRLTGHDPRLLNPGPPPQLESVPVRIQIGDAIVAGALEGDLREQLQQLLPKQLAYLQQVVDPPSLPGEVEVIEGEIVDIEIDGVPCFHHEPLKQLAPHLERIPYGEAERLIGQELEESSITHPELLVEPPVLVVEVLPNGQVEYDPRLGEQIEGLALAAESSEDRAESAGEAVAELSPEERSAVETVQQFFAQTGLQAFEGKHYRLRMAGNQLSVEAKDGRGEVLAMDGEKAVSRLEAQDFQQFDAARELLGKHLQLPEPSQSMTLNRPDFEIEA